MRKTKFKYLSIKIFNERYKSKRYEIKRNFNARLNQEKIYRLYFEEDTIVILYPERNIFKIWNRADIPLEVLDDIRSVFRELINYDLRQKREKDESTNQS